MSRLRQSRTVRRFAPGVVGIVLALTFAPPTSVGASLPAAALSNGSGSVVVVIDATGFDTANPAIHNVVADEVCLDALGGQSWEQSYCPDHVAQDTGPGAATPQLTSTGAYVFSGSEHGTAVASEVASAAPGAKLIVIRSLYSTTIALKWVIAHASDYNIAAVVMSEGAFNELPSQRGYVPCDQQTETVGSVNIPMLPYVQQLATLNVPFVVSAGNDANAQYIDFPACVTGVVSVGALDTSTTVASYSDISPSLSLLAPGTLNVANEVPFGNYAIASEQGTSFAAPYVAGVFAMVHASYPTMPFNSELAAMRTSGTLINDTIVKSIPAVNVAALSTLLASGATIPSLASTMAAQEASVATTSSTDTALQGQLAADQAQIATLTAQLQSSATGSATKQVSSLLRDLVRLSPPRVTTIARSGTAVKVSWSVNPVLTSNTTARYVVRANPGAMNCVSSIATSCAVHGLHPGTSYTFEVRMITPQGNSPWSARTIPFAVR
ncbi:MAG: S8 family serine peptidase [Acidimicrobiales bacterium]